VAPEVILDVAPLLGGGMRAYRLHLTLIVMRASIALILTLLLVPAAYGARRRAVAHPGSIDPPVSHVFVVVLENTNAATALQQPFLQRLIREGALLRNYHGIAHPSQPNYFAMTAGDTYGVTGDGNVNLAVRHLGDVLEEHGRSWKVYAEDYKGNCSLADDGLFARRHVPFLSYKDIQNDHARCVAHVLNASALYPDLATGSLPNYALYVPNDRNNGHDTSAAFADQQMQLTFGPLLGDPRFTRGLLFVVTFDESESYAGNDIVTVCWGPRVAAGQISNAPYNHYSLLRTIEEIYGTGTLGRKDAEAAPIDDVIRYETAAQPLRESPAE
jgi:hypothetical protein